MPGTNDFLQYAGGGGANVLSQTLYAALTERTNGAQTGTAVSANFNKAMRQATFISAGIAGWLAAQNINVPDDGNLTSFINNLLAQIPGKVITNIAALRNLPKGGSVDAFVLGYTSINDGGGGEYYYDATDTTSADNNGTIIVATDGGRWKLIWDDFLAPEQFGAVGNGVIDDTVAVQNCLNAAATFVNQNTADITKRRQYLPVWFVDKIYKITSQVAVPAGVLINTEGGLILNALASTTVFAMQFNAGSHCANLDMLAAGGSGVQFGNIVGGVGQYCDMLVTNVQIIGAGTATSIVGCRLVGTAFDVGSIDVTGGFVGIDFGDGTTNGARLVNIASLKSTHAATGVRFSSNAEHISLPNCLIDTPSVVGLTIDGSHSLRIRGIIFGDDTAGYAPCSSGYAAILGNTSALSDIDLDLIVNNTASADTAVGTAIKISNCTQGKITLNASRATLATGNVHRLKNAIEYGAGNAFSLNVEYVVDPNIVLIVGTPTGNLSQFGAGIPTGGSIDFTGPIAPPGFIAWPLTLTLVSTTTYAALFAAIGYTWGGAGASFALPFAGADYSTIQANGNVGTQGLGVVKAHTHTVPFAPTTMYQIYNSGAISSGTGVETIAQTPTGGLANLAAGARVLKCVKY